MKLLGKYLLCLFSIGLNIKYLFYRNDIASSSSCITTTESEDHPGHRNEERHHCKRVHFQCLEKEKLNEFFNAYTTELIKLRLSLTSETSTKLIDEHFKTVQNLLAALSSTRSTKKTAGNNHHNKNDNNKNNNKKERNVSEIIKMVAELRNRNAASSNNTTNKHNEQKGKQTSSKMSRINQTLVYSCGEKYLGTLNGYPLYNTINGGFVHRKQCEHANEREIPTNRSTSLILDRPAFFDNTDDGHQKNIPISTFKEMLRFVTGTFQEVHIMLLRKNINNFHGPTSIIKEFSKQQWPNIFFHLVSRRKGKQGDNISNTLNRICRKLNSPFVVIATKIVLINTEFNLKRMLHVIQDYAKEAMNKNNSYENNDNNDDENKNYSKNDKINNNNNNKLIRVIASSVKNYQTGIWETGCYQTTLKLYNLDYKSGYSKSKNSCLKCDFVKGGAFLVATSLFKRQHDDGQPYQFRYLGDGEETLYEDFFLRLTRDSKHEILVCPDSMVYSTPKDDFSQSKIVSFARHWNISTLLWHTQQVFQFRALGGRWGHCPTLLIELNEKCRVPKGIAIPPCCLSLLYDGIEFVTRLFDIHHIQYMLVEGTALGAVKFDGLLPWEQDADLAIRSDDFPKLEYLSSEFLNKNYTLVIDEKAVVDKNSTSNLSETHGGVAHVRVYHWSLQIFGYNSLTLQTGPQTKIKFKRNGADNDRYFLASVPENPAKYCRNRYGHEIFKHAEHWMVTGEKSGWVDYDSGHFEECGIPGHNACLNQFDGDGNLEFVER